MPFDVFQGCLNLTNGAYNQIPTVRGLRQSYYLCCFPFTGPIIVRVHRALDSNCSSDPLS